MRGVSGAGLFLRFAVPIGMLTVLALPAIAQDTQYASWSWPGRPIEAVRADTLDRPGPPPDAWLGRDKALHAGGSFLLTLSAQYVLTAKFSAQDGEALPIAAGGALALGVAKEVMDSQRALHPLFSTKDLVADAVGVLLAVGVILL